MGEWFRSTRSRFRNAYGRWRYSWDGRAPASLLLVALVLGLVLGLWWGRWSDGPETASPSDRARLSEGPDRRPGTHGARAERIASTNVRLDRCQVVYVAQDRPLRAVGPAMTQWEVHIGAMNKLVVGAISLAQAQEFWNQTREGAARNLATYRRTQRAFDERPARCALPVGRGSDELRTCAEAVADRHRELDRAAVALDTWRTHVRHMEMLRRGQMTPGEATRMWLESWREGNREVEAYRSAARGARPDAGEHGGHQDGAGGPCA